MLTFVKHTTGITQQKYEFPGVSSQFECIITTKITKPSLTIEQR